MEKLEVLRTRQERLSREIGDIQGEIDEITRGRLISSLERTMVGKCFKCKNRDWWVYRKVTRIISNTTAMIIEFSLDNYEGFVGEKEFRFPFDSKCKKITVEEFEREFEKIKCFINEKLKKV